jgi:hypothetical protein
MFKDGFCPYLHVCSKCRSSRHAARYCDVEVEPCARFNSDKCLNDAYHCKFRHVCSFCLKEGHTRRSCEEFNK